MTTWIDVRPQRSKSIMESNTTGGNLESRSMLGR